MASVRSTVRQCAGQEGKTCAAHNGNFFAPADRYCTTTPCIRSARARLAMIFAYAFSVFRVVRAAPWIGLGLGFFATRQFKRRAVPALESSFVRRIEALLRNLLASCWKRIRWPRLRSARWRVHVDDDLLFPVFAN